MVNWFSRLLMLLGRIFIGLIFLWSAINKVVNYDVYRQMVASKGIEEVSLYIVGALLVELLGAIALIFGYWTRFGSLVLMVYLIPTTMIFHEFWLVATTGSAHLQTEFFLRNLGLFGGLLYIFSCGPGLLAFDNYRRCRLSVEEDQE